MRKYAVREIFNTLQGEGARAGTRAVFVRLAGCNLWSGREQDRDKGSGACARWCDTDFFKGTPMTAQEIAARCDELWPGDGPFEGPWKWIVLTGGEPTLQLDRELMAALTAAGFHLSIETNGTNNPMDAAGYLLDDLAHVCVSPKKGAPIVRKTGHELKVVVPGGAPGFESWTEDEISRMGRMFHEVFIQPEDGPNAIANRQTAIEMVMRHPGWRLSFQVHKALGLP